MAAVAAGLPLPVGEGGGEGFEPSSGQRCSSRGGRFMGCAERYSMSRQRVTVFVCVSCRAPAAGGDSDFSKPGEALAPAIEAHLRNAGATDIDVRPVECLAVCKRPCTVAFAAENKWTYIVGDVDAEAHAAEIAAAAQSFAASENGIIPWRERPLCLRKGVIARVPPQTYRFTRTAE